MRCAGELKRLRPSSVGEVGAYLSCVRLSGYVEMIRRNLEFRVIGQGEVISQKKEKSFI